jgi:hypothetical protein
MPCNANYIYSIPLEVASNIFMFIFYLFDSKIFLFSRKSLGRKQHAVPTLLFLYSVGYIYIYIYIYIYGGFFFWRNGYSFKPLFSSKKLLLNFGFVYFTFIDNSFYCKYLKVESKYIFERNFVKSEYVRIT